MNKIKSLSGIVLFLASIFTARFAPAEMPAYVAVTAPLVVDSSTAVPGKVLKAGAYTIEVVDHLKERYILRVDDAKGKPLTTFIGLHHADFAPAPTGKQGAIFWAGSPKGSVSVRGFIFSNGTALEFVYPRLEAIALAKLNVNSVLAVDPESEGLKPDPKLTPEDREVVTLWMLKSTRIGGPKESIPAIEAQQFNESATATVASSTPRQAPEKFTPAKQFNLAQADISKPSLRPATRQPRIASQLPKTASEFPMMLLSASLLIFVAGGLRMSRRIA